MNDSIKSFYIYKRRVFPVSIFGYVSKGLPGVELFGLGSLSKGIKEKLIFLTRSNQLKLPLKRFVIGIETTENHPREKIREEVKFLELPILILFWRLAKILPISSLKQCLTSGYIGIPGELRPLELNKVVYERMEREDTWIGIPNGQVSKKKLNLININFLFGQINELKIIQARWRDF